MSVNTQTAPFPTELQELIDALVYKPGWSFELHHLGRGQGSLGLTLSIYVQTTNSYHSDQIIRVHHPMPVPPAAYDVRSWQHWLFEQITLVERHEACEFFTIDGVKPYAPSHGPGNDPYLVREVGTELDVKTAYTGAVNP